MGRKTLKKDGKNAVKKSDSALFDFLEIVDYIMSELLDFLTCIYMLLILAVMPFYFQDGFSHIGSDKSYFFRNVTFRFGIVAYVFLAVYLSVKGLMIGLSPKKDVLAEKSENIMQRLKTSCNLSTTDIFAIIYGAGVVLSYFCSSYKEQALVGADKWYMGTLPQFAFVSVYFFISRFWKRHGFIPLLVLPVSAVVFALGILNRFGIYPIDMKIVNIEFISTIGNINWYCGYAVTVFFAGIAFLWLGGAERRWQKALMCIYGFLGYATLVTQGSDSALFTIAVMTVVMFVLSASDDNMLELGKLVCMFAAACAAMGLAGRCSALKESYESCTAAYPLIKTVTGSRLTFVLVICAAAFMLFVSAVYNRNSLKSADERLLSKTHNFDVENIMKKIRMIVAALAAAGVLSIILFIIVNTLQGGRITAGLLYFNIDWGSGRGASYRAAVWSFAEQNLLHKLVGVGPDCMSAYIYDSAAGGRILEVVNEKFGTLRLTNAHNEWLTILVNQGIVGIVGFAGIICSAVYRYIKDRKVCIAPAVCGIGILAYTINNIFSFQTSMNVPTMFVLLGIGEAYMRAGEKQKE
jgi:hypothetical protein